MRNVNEIPSSLAPPIVRTQASCDAAMGLMKLSPRPSVPGGAGESAAAVCYEGGSASQSYRSDSPSSSESSGIEIITLAAKVVDSLHTQKLPEGFEFEDFTPDITGALCKMAAEDVVLETRCLFELSLEDNMVVDLILVCHQNCFSNLLDLPSQHHKQQSTCI